jgi:hypothetical protein
MIELIWAGCFIKDIALELEVHNQPLTASILYNMATEFPPSNLLSSFLEI